jgi:signal transduction histidine kinase
MSAPPPDAHVTSTADTRTGYSATSNAADWERGLGHGLRTARWIGWRLRALMAAALLGCLAIFILIRTLSTMPALSLSLRSDAGMLVLAETDAPQRAVQALVDTQGQTVAIDTLLLLRSARWLVDNSDRIRQAEEHDALAQSVATGRAQLLLAGGERVALETRAPGAAGLGAPFWLTSALALLLYLVTMVVVLVRPSPINLLYAVISLTQVGNLLFIATESIPALVLPVGFMGWDLALRSSFDLAAAAAVAHVTSLHPRRIPGHRARALVVWLAVLALSIAVATDAIARSWWWVQVTTLACGVLALIHLGWIQRTHPHPMAAMLRRLCSVGVGTMTLLTLSIAALDPSIQSQNQMAAIGATVWVVFMASTLLMLPFLSRTQQLMREFSLLAGVSTVATSLDLLFVAVFSIGNFASLTLALFISLGVYAGLRQWLLNRVLAHERVTTERMFEHLYRIARAVQARPQSVGEHLTRLLRELFDPLEVKLVARRVGRARVVGNGATLLVPVPQFASAAMPSVIVLGFAQRGRRMFNDDDAQLAERVVDQLARAVAFDQAVERGRSEERVRIAQDLHDDIGARLLTLMYKAPTREMEDYLRHTLKDLKTLTRGLAASNHRLSHAVAEWKSDITQRLAAANCELGWSFTYDNDIELSMAQWSALTRVLRELVSNTLAHAHASRVEIDASLQDGQFSLSVIDNGGGRNPQAWSHGLGLGGVRKRVKQLGGDVQWQEHGTQGIACKVEIRNFGAST